MHLPFTNPTWIFFVMLSIILFAPMVLERLRIPSIAGLIFAGILIGPEGLHLLERDASFELFGKVGIYYIMFLASLEMNLQEVRQSKQMALGFGLLSFAIPFSIGVAANMSLLGYGLMAALLMASMYASHTLISYPIILRYGLSRRRSVNMAVGGTIVADTATLLVLAIVSETFKQEITGLFWLMLFGKLVHVWFVIFCIFPYVARFFFKRYNDGVVQYIFVLSMVFLGAGLMELIGMEGILGAFLVGIVLNPLIPATSPLMNHVEFIGNALFIPYFLIGVGMLIDIRALINVNALGVAAVMLFVGFTGKWLAAYIAQRFYKFSAADRRLVFGLSNSRAAATLAIVLVGFQIMLPDGSHLIGEDVLNGAMILILVSCVMSSFTTESASRMIVRAEASGEMTEKSGKMPAREDRIVIALKSSATLEGMVHLALMLRTPGSPAPLSAINIVLEGGEETRRQGKADLEQAARIAAAANVRMQTHSRWSVNVVSGLSHAMKELDASDLVIGLHKRERLFEPFFGKIATDLFAAVDRQIIVTRLVEPINTIRHMHLVVPRRAELEQGFGGWADRIALLGEQLSVGITAYSSSRTLEAMSKRWKGNSALRVEYVEFDSWTDYMPIARNTRQDHLMVFVMARQGSLSYSNNAMRMPDQIERYFSSRSLLLIMPAQYRGTIGKTSVLITK